MKKRKRTDTTKWLILLGVPITSVVILTSLVFYIYTWVTNNKLLVINETTSTGYLPLIIGIVISVAFNIGLTIYYATSLNKVKKLIESNCAMSELILKLQMRSTDKILDAVKEGKSND